MGRKASPVFSRVCGITWGGLNLGRGQGAGIEGTSSSPLRTSRDGTCSLLTRRLQAGMITLVGVFYGHLCRGSSGRGRGNMCDVVELHQ